MAEPVHNTQAFRDRYRSSVRRWYSPWLHGGFVLAYGTICLAFFVSRLDQVALWHWLVVPVGLLFFSWGEYQVHRRLGHHKTRLGGLFYKRHTGDHHSFFVEGRMRYESARDWRVILFPAWLIVLYSLPLFAAWWLLAHFDPNLAALFAGSMMLGYLSYELLHSCEHLPDEHPLSRLPWIRQMRRHHRLHHRRSLMRGHNFGIVHPLMDWLYGTLYRDPEEGITVKLHTRMTHEVSIAQPARTVLDYAAAATRWPEWHPSSLRVEGPQGPLDTGATFEEDIHAGGRDAHLRWNVLDHQPGRRWQARAAGDNGLHLLLTYECTAEDGGTRFVRTLEYGFDGLLLRIANRLALSRRVDRESVASLQQLKGKLEAPLA